MTGEAQDVAGGSFDPREPAEIEALIVKDVREALARSRQALATVDRAREPRRAAALLALLGRILGLLDQHDEAEIVLGEAASLYRALEDRGGLAGCLLGLGTAEVRRGLLAEALGRFDEAHRLTVEAGNRPGIVRALNAIGCVYGTLRDHGEAARIYREAAETGRSLGTLAEKVIPLCNLAQSYIIKVWESDPETDVAADIEAAWAAMEEARAGLTENAPNPFRMGVLAIVAQCENLKNDAEAALRTCRTLLEEATSLKLVSMQASAHREFASAYLTLGRYDEAVVSARLAVELFRQINFVHETTFPLKTLALAEERRGNFAAALAAQREYQDTRWRVTREASERYAAFLKARVALEKAQGEALMHRRIAEELEAKNRELTEAKKTAETARDAKGAFLSMMGHELRSPLQAILGFSSVIAMRLYGDGAMDRYVSAATDIHGAGQHLLKLINQILDYSKGEIGKLRLEEDTAQLSQIVKSAIKMVADQAQRAGVKVKSAIDKDVYLVVDELKLTQCVLNTLSNAVKFTPPGGEVVLTVAIEPRYLTIAIRDSGIGIAAEDIPKVFEPFGQGRNALRREGTGLGVPLSKMLMELHGGDFELESELGRGTTVYLRLPIERLADLAVGEAIGDLRSRPAEPAPTRLH